MASTSCFQMALQASECRSASPGALLLNVTRYARARVARALTIKASLVRIVSRTAGWI